MKSVAVKIAQSGHQSATRAMYASPLLTVLIPESGHCFKPPFPRGFRTHHQSLTSLADTGIHICVPQALKLRKPAAPTV